MNSLVQTLQQSHNSSSDGNEPMLYLSRRVFIEKIDGCYGCFVPDKYGMPIVVSGNVYQLLQNFKNGNLLSNVLKSLPENAQQNASKYTKYLFDRGVLREAPSPDRYVAHDLIDIDSIKSFSIRGSTPNPSIFPTTVNLAKNP